MKRIIGIFLTAAVLTGCAGVPADSQSQPREEDNASRWQDQQPAASSEELETPSEQPQPEPELAGASAQQDGEPEQPQAEQPEDGQAAVAQAMLRELENWVGVNYARLIDMDADGTAELLVATADMDCWAWQWTGERLNLITLGSPIDRGNDGQMGGVTDQVSLVQAPDGTYGVLCQGSTDLEFYTYRFLDLTECYENRSYYEWISSPEYDGNAPDPENYYYRNGEPISRAEFEQGIARCAVEEPISQPFDGSFWDGHLEETLAALEEMAAA